jgi:hypothetical protein
MSALCCDGCGKERKPYRYLRDGEYERGIMLCFLCVKQGERDEVQERRRNARERDGWRF